MDDGIVHHKALEAGEGGVVDGEGEERWHTAFLVWCTANRDSHKVKVLKECLGVFHFLA